MAELGLDGVRARHMPNAGGLRDSRRCAAIWRWSWTKRLRSRGIAKLCAQCRRYLALRDLLLFDVYRGNGVDGGCKSFAIGLIFQDDSRTLSDADVDRWLPP